MALGTQSMIFKHQSVLKMFGMGKLVLYIRFKVRKGAGNFELKKRAFFFILSYIYIYLCLVFFQILKDEGDEDDDFINDGEVTEAESSFSSSEEVKSSSENDGEKSKKGGSRKYKTRSRAKEDGNDS